jgi:hypothetical protein
MLFALWLSTAFQKQAYKCVSLKTAISTGVVGCDMKRSEKLFYVTKRTDGTSCSIRSTLGDSAGR